MTIFAPTAAGHEAERLLRRMIDRWIIGANYMAHRPMLDPAHRAAAEAEHGPGRAWLAQLNEDERRLIALLEVPTPALPPRSAADEPVCWCCGRKPERRRSPT